MLVPRNQSVGCFRQYEHALRWRRRFVDAAVSQRCLRGVINIAAQVGGFAVENRAVGGFKFGVGDGIGKEAE